MKHIIFTLFIFFILGSFKCSSQIWKESLNLEFTAEKINDSTAKLSIVADITPGWHVFSKHHDPNKSDFIGLPLEISVAGDGLEKLGEFTETPSAHELHDEFGTSMILENKAIFSQSIRLLKDNAKGVMTINGQVCSDEKGCFPFKKDYDFELNELHK